MFDFRLPVQEDLSLLVQTDINDLGQKLGHSALGNQIDHFRRSFYTYDFQEQLWESLEIWKKIDQLMTDLVANPQDNYVDARLYLSELHTGLSLLMPEILIVATKSYLRDQQERDCLDDLREMRQFSYALSSEGVIYYPGYITQVNSSLRKGVRNYCGRSEGFGRALDTMDYVVESYKELAEDLLTIYEFYPTVSCKKQVSATFRELSKATYQVVSLCLSIPTSTGFYASQKMANQAILVRTELMSTLAKNIEAHSISL